MPNATTRVYKMVDLLSVAKSPFRSPSTVAARCDMDTDSGGWIVIQRRVANGTVNFTRGWCDYQNGFGDLEGEFWYGLNNIHHLTSQESVELRIDMIMEDDGSHLSWTYLTFRVAGPSDNYRLTIGDGQGPGRDAMAIQNQQQFSTYDNDIIMPSTLAGTRTREDGGTMRVTWLISMDPTALQPTPGLTRGLQGSSGMMGPTETWPVWR